MNKNVVFQTRLKELRKEHKMKQCDVANIIGTSVQAYSTYENGREPRYSILFILADYFNVTTDYLLGFSNSKKPQYANITQTLNLRDKAIANVIAISNKSDALNLFLENLETELCIRFLENIIKIRG